MADEGFNVTRWKQSKAVDAYLDQLCNNTYRSKNMASLACKAAIAGHTTWTTAIPTAAVAIKSDRVILMINPTFWDEQFAIRGRQGAIQFLAFVKAHEAMHVMFHHMNRGKALAEWMTRDEEDKAIRKHMMGEIQKFYNIAADCLINQWLVSLFSHYFFQHPHDYLYDESGNPVLVADYVDQNGYTWCGGHRMKWYFLDQYPELWERGRYDKGGLNGFTTREIFDYLWDNAEQKEMFIGSMIGGDDLPEVTDEDLEAEGSGYSEEEDEERQAMDRALGAGWGKGVKELQLPDGNRYEFSWEKVVSDFIASHTIIESTDTWTRCNHRLYSMYPDSVLPVEADEMVRGKVCAVFLDISGSMNPDKIYGMADLVSKMPKKGVEYKYYLFNSDILPISEERLVSKKFEIGGGTSFHAIEQQCRALETYPDIVCVLTDGEAYHPDVQWPDRWLWVLDGVSPREFEKRYAKAVELPRG